MVITTPPSGGDKLRKEIQNEWFYILNEKVGGL